MAEVKWSGVLSTTEPRNDVGIIKVRQGNINSEIAEFQIVQNNKPYDLTGLTVYFCASFELNLVEKPAVVVNATGGRIQYTFDDDSMQAVGRQKGYFSIKKAENKIDSTQEFEFQVESSLMTRSIDGKSYIYKLSTLIKVLDDFIKNGQNNFNTWFDSVKEILYGVDPGGNILRELIEARKNSSGNIFASLKARLDKNEDDTAAQFAQKASISYLESVLSSYSGGGVKDVFYSITALYTAHPNGALGPILVYDTTHTDGAHMYTWVTDKWKDIGLFNPDGIAKGAVTPEKTDFIDVSPNLFDKSKVIDGGYYNGDGVWVTDPLWSSSPPVNVDHGQLFSSNLNGSAITFYDINLARISNTGGGTWTTSFTVPNISTIKYATFALNKTTVNLDTATVVKGNSLPSGYIPYGSVLQGRIELSEKAKLEFIKNSQLELSPMKNRFNIGTVQNGYELYSDGTFRTNTQSMASGYIEVKDLEDIYISRLTPYNVGLDRYAYFFDINKVKIGTEALKIAKTLSEAIFIVPSNAYYFAFSIYQRKTSSEVIDLTKIQIEEGVVKTDYEPYEIGISKIKNYKIQATDNSGREKLKTYGKSLLIFADSIGETATVSDDGATYTEGTRSNWPTFSKTSLQIGAMWNYAKSGASYKNRNLDPRQYIGHQIQTAINNNRPGDIIVVGAGTNDSEENLGDYDTAMSKSSLANLDTALLYEAIRWAFWTLRLNYPNATCYASTPTQRANREPQLALREAIIKMANRYNFIVIDSEYESGIVRDFETDPSNRRDTSDGLHPALSGQIKMSKLHDRVILNTYMS